MQPAPRQWSTGARTLRKSRESYARGLENGPVRAVLGKGVMQLLLPVFAWRYQCDHASLIEEIDFADGDPRSLLFFGLSAFLDGFAKGAGMPAVECPLQRMAEIRVPGVGNYHGHPCRGLQHRPVPVERGQHRHNDEPPAKCFASMTHWDVATVLPACRGCQGNRAGVGRYLATSFNWIVIKSCTRCLPSFSKNLPDP